MPDPRMFDTPGPRVFGLPPGVDFPAALIEGLRARLPGPPEAMARVELFVNTDRMARRLQALFDAGPPGLLPRVRLVTDLADPLTRASLPAPVPPLRRRLELTGLVSKLLDAEPDLAPHSALFDLSDSLARLMEEMHGEGVAPETIAALNVDDLSGHWQRALRFLRIVQGYFEGDSAPDLPAFTRRALEVKLAHWAETPPQHPVIVAGSTGSRGTTAALMETVAQLPQGAVVLPGFDSEMPQTIWDRLDDPLRGEDHPQYRFSRLMQTLGLAAGDIHAWTEVDPPSKARNRVLSLALRPAPVTHQWRTEGPGLPDLREVMADVTLLEAPSLREEALTIALRLRQAAEDGTTAALITPDRMLTRQVAAALDRWGILPDDSAGTPAHLTPPGRLLRLVAELFTAPLTAQTLLSLLKHPLTHAGTDRGAHLLNTRDLELHIRKAGMPYPDATQLAAWGATAGRDAWAAWLGPLDRLYTPDRLPLADWVTRHIDMAERLVAGAGDDDASALWQLGAGRKLREICDQLRAEAHHGTQMSATDYAALFDGLLTREEVRDRDAPHPRIRIWGTLEARVMGAELLILASLNEGSWPEVPAADPWLNRKMRAEAGLLLPDRRIGLSAHDFQQAAAAPEVWLCRALKSDEAETVPARWINRLTNLLSGLPMRHGPEALEQMKARAADWLARAHASEAPIPAQTAPRPSPAPPASARPDRLSVTAIKRLVRDPYAIYAREVLRLRPLDPLMQAPDALLRGILTHEVFERFVKDSRDDPDRLTIAALLAQTEALLHDRTKLPFPVVRTLWTSRIARIADWFVTGEVARQARARPAAFETGGAATIPALGFTLTGKADRIDIDDRGGAIVYDYKTGAAPSAKEQRHFDKQLLLEAAMLMQGAFPDLAPRFISGASFIQLKPGDPREVDAPLDEAPPETVWEEFTALMAAYADPDRGYTARRALLKDSDSTDYDHLSRFGEWEVTDMPVRRRLT